jgi:hypothetical protein
MFMTNWLLDTNLCVQKITKKKNININKALLMGLNIQKGYYLVQFLLLYVGWCKQIICVNCFSYINTSFVK